MILNRLRLNSKKRRHDDNLDQRAERITFDAVPGHRYSLLVIKLCILIYTRTNCGLRTVVKILEIFGEVFEGKCGMVPCYNTVENWMKKLWVFVEVRLQYHLTDKAFLLPPNMRTIARFMNMSSWVDWGQHMLHAYSILPKETQEAYSFVPENKILSYTRNHTLICVTVVDFGLQVLGCRFWVGLPSSLEQSSIGNCCLYFKTAV